MIVALNAVLNIGTEAANALAIALSALLLLLNLENVLIGFALSLRYPLADMQPDTLAEPQP